jgi:hypothetical protein
MKTQVVVKKVLFVGGILWLGSFFVVILPYFSIKFREVEICSRFHRGEIGFTDFLILLVSFLGYGAIYLGFVKLVVMIALRRANRFTPPPATTKR